MAHNETERAKNPRPGKAAPAQPHVGAGVEATESGPPRLYAPPGRPHPVESGPPRLYSPASGGRAAVAAPGNRPAARGVVDATESGPPRLSAPAGGPQAAEAGPARLGALASDPQARAARKATGRPQTAANVDATESGPRRLQQYLT